MWPKSAPKWLILLWYSELYNHPWRKMFEYQAIRARYEIKVTKKRIVRA